MNRRIFNAAIGFLGGVITAPLAVIVWPVVFAYFMYNDNDDDYE